MWAPGPDSVLARIQSVSPSFNPLAKPALCLKPLAGLKTLLCPLALLGPPPFSDSPKPKPLVKTKTKK